MRSTSTLVATSPPHGSRALSAPPPPEPICSACGQRNPAGFRFCGACGARLDGSPLDGPRIGGARPAGPRPPAEIPSAEPPRRNAVSERRQVTVMFCDLVGSTQLGELLDPEDLRELILAYRDVCAASVARYDGSVARYLGDGILVYFGYPKAHEDDPRRAILAALDIRQGMRRLNESFIARHWPQLDLRIGIHTGLVVAGDMGTAMTHEPMAVVGSAPNIAARLQAQAAPNAIVVGSATHDIVEGFFAVRPLGARVLAGIAEPVAIYEVLGETGARDRLGARPSRHDLLGRTREVELLRDRWAKAQAGAGQCVVVEGAPGIGKSRLLRAFATRAEIDPQRILSGQCAEYYETTAFHPIATLVDHAREQGGGVADALDPGLAALLQPASPEE
ncbi:MAG: adenylate/guanylate cyclase domain-containing protein, partial [Alphaproteobacteria bacterium]